MSSDEETVERALERLSGPAGASWRAPDQVRRTARRRKRGRLAVLGAGGLAVATAVTLALALLGPRSSPAPVADGPRNGARIGSAIQLVANVKPVAGPSSSDERAVVTAEQEFTFALLKRVNAAGGSANVVLSPASLAIALAMLRNGAGGQTEREIAAVLHTSGLTDAQLDSGWAALSADLQTGGVLDSANSLWLQHGAPMQAPFMNAMARYFRTGVWQVDFAHDLAGANRSINAWVSQQTRGKITKLFNPGDLDPSTLLVLANAVYFKAAWKTAFDRKQTADATFHTGAGAAVSTPFMTTGENSSTLVAQNADTMAVQLPYAGGPFAALAVMPRTQPLADFVSALTPETLGTLTAQLHPSRVTVSLPKFEVSQYTRLDSVLKAMGMPTAFGPRADLSPMSPLAAYVKSVVQRDYLKVDEKGTEAAAVTGSGVEASAAHVPLTFDHPFLFLVRDTKTGAIVFSAQIQDPTG
ncbi:MAG: serpin family protein [Jatrophihabitantaceae bacterium]